MRKIVLGALLVVSGCYAAAPATVQLTTNQNGALRALEQELPPDYLWILKNISQSPAANITVDDSELTKNLFRWKYWSYETHNFMIHQTCARANTILGKFNTDVWDIAKLLHSLEPAKSNRMLCVSFENGISVEIKYNPPPN